MQTALYAADGIGNGNCLVACLASLLDLPIWMIPPFEQMFGRSEWRVRVSEWLEKTQGMQMVRLEDHQTEILPEFYIANGPSPRGVYHSTIYSKGELRHDPHFSGLGIQGVEWTWHLESINK